MSGAGRRIHGGAAQPFPEGVTRRIRTGDSDIVIVKAAGRYYAIENSCPHQHFAALHEGQIEKFTLRCPMHGWKFDFRTGRSASGDGCLKTHPVTVTSDDLLIAVD